MSWLKKGRKGFLLAIHVQPGASKTRVMGVYGERLKIAVAAPPVDGKANSEVVAFLASKLGVAKGDAEVVSGMKARQKTVAVYGSDWLDECDVRKSLTMEQGKQ